MIIPDQLKLDDIVAFSLPLDEAYPGLWIVVRVGTEWCDIINREGQVAHFGTHGPKGELLRQGIFLHRIRRASKLDKLILFHDHFYGRTRV